MTNYCGTTTALCCGSAPCYIGSLESLRRLRYLESLRRLRDALSNLDVGNETVPAPVFVGTVDGTEIMTRE